MLREELVAIKNASHADLWTVMEDFNAVLSREERKGRLDFNLTCTRLFKDFVEDMNLTDLPLTGRKFTWSNTYASSRLDRFLVVPSWLYSFPDCSQVGLCRECSDHNPILLKLDSVNWGPKRFRFYSAWLSNPRFRKKLADWWENFNGSTFGPNKIIFKLKLLKEKLKEECFTPFDDTLDNVKALELELESLDMIDENVGFLDSQRARRREITQEIWNGQTVLDSEISFLLTYGKRNFSRRFGTPCLHQYVGVYGRREIWSFSKELVSVEQG